MSHKLRKISEALLQPVDIDAPCHKQLASRLANYQAETRLLGHLIIQETEGDFPLPPNPITDSYISEAMLWLREHPGFLDKLTLA